MRPLSELSGDEARKIRFVLTDIDDTITKGGRLPADSYAALWRLAEAGLHVIPVTGRPAGWCDLIARQWPVDGVIGENGAFALYQEAGHLRRIDHPAAPQPQANRERLMAIAEEVFATVPGTRPAKDQFARQFDVAIDFREEPPELDLTAAERIRTIFAAHGARAKVSSIHVNAWFGDYDKRSMAACFLDHRFQLDIDDPAGNRAAVFVGDSPNDEPMFERFAVSVAVANIRAFLTQLSTPPVYVTELESAAGFVEFVNHLLDRRA